MLSGTNNSPEQKSRKIPYRTACNQPEHIIYDLFGVSFRALKKGLNMSYLNSRCQAEKQRENLRRHADTEWLSEQIS